MVAFASVFSFCYLRYYTQVKESKEQQPSESQCPRAAPHYLVLLAMMVLPANRNSVVGRARVASSRAAARSAARDKRQELRKVRRAETSDRIPAREGGETIRAAAGVAALRDVVERGGAGRVQEGVQEPERALAGVEELVVQESDDGRERGAGRARAGDTLALTTDVDDEVDTLRGDVGERTALWVEEASVRVAELVEVGGDCVVLVAGAGENVRETTR